MRVYALRPTAAAGERTIQEQLGRLLEMAQEEGMEGDWSGQTARARCDEYGTLLRRVVTARTVSDEQDD